MSEIVLSLNGDFTKVTKVRKESDLAKIEGDLLLGYPVSFKGNLRMVNHTLSRINMNEGNFLENLIVVATYLNFTFANAASEVMSEKLEGEYREMVKLVMVSANHPELQDQILENIVDQIDEKPYLKKFASVNQVYITALTVIYKENPQLAEAFAVGR